MYSFDSIPNGYTDISQLAEQVLHTDKVTGSNPVVAIQLRANVTEKYVDVHISKQNVRI